MEYRKQYRKGSHASPGIGWSVILIMSLVALVLALPALALGIVLQRLTSMRPWSFLLWFVLTLVGAGLIYYLSTHGLDRMITAQLTDYVLAIKRHHADIARWNISRLWSETWPVWIRTLVVTPIIAFGARWRRVGMVIVQVFCTNRRRSVNASSHVQKAGLPDELTIQNAYQMPYTGRWWSESRLMTSTPNKNRAQKTE